MTSVQLAAGQHAHADHGQLVRASDVLWRCIPGAAVMLLRSSDDVVVLSGTGIALWEQLAAPRSLDEVATVLAARYGVTPDEVLLGLDGVLSELRRRGFLVQHDG